jgi:hypothetical protein
MSQGSLLPGSKRERAASVPNYTVSRRKDHSMNFNHCRNWGLDEKISCMFDDRKMTEVLQDMPMEVVVAYFKVEPWDIRQIDWLRHYFK